MVWKGKFQVNRKDKYFWIFDSNILILNKRNESFVNILKQKTEIIV